jgi:hypothetical protein
MKPLFLTLLLRLIFLLLSYSGIQLHAQFAGTHSTMIPVDFDYDLVERSGNAMTINYDQSDELLFGINYKHILFPIHRGYDTIAGQNLVYASYTLDSLLKADNSYTISFGNINSLVLDSMDIQLGHVKHSGANDTIFFSLLGLDPDNFPGGTVVLKDTVVLTSALSPSNMLTNTVALSWKPGFAMGNTAIGLKIEFVGSLQDTLALMGGYGIFPAPNACTDDTLDKARKSHIYPNSYAYWSNYHLLIPTNAQGDIFYNCDTVITKDTADSESYIQNWAITSYVSAPSIGMEEQEESRLTIYPNPASNIILMKGVLAIDAVKIYNNAGSCIRTWVNPSYLDVSDLNNGIYIFAFEYENRTVHKKVVIQH